MSYDAYDAWLDEKARQPFDFELLELGDIAPTAGVRYLHAPALHSAACLGLLHDRLRFAFGYRSDDARLQEALQAVVEVVHAAIDSAECEARDAFMSGESLNRLCMGVGPHGLDEPARAFIESLDAVGPPDGFSEQDLCAGLGLLLIGNLSRLDDARVPDLHALETWSLGEAALLLAEAQWYLGKAAALREGESSLSSRNRKAAEVRHVANRERKRKARQWYLEHGVELDVKADASREIQKQFNVTFEVAKRWVTQFHRGTVRPGPNPIKR